MCAVVFVVTTLTEPARLTAAVPAIPALMPTAAMSSLFVAVTATPRKPPIVPFVIVARAEGARVAGRRRAVRDEAVRAAGCPWTVSVTTVPPSVDLLVEELAATFEPVTGVVLLAVDEAADRRCRRRRCR